jgi:ureidoglycolate dehydrogenase (NAD+)
MRGVHTHGLYLVPKYLRAIREGAIKADGRPEVLTESPSTAVVDGHAAMGEVVAREATMIAIEKAKSNGVALVVVRGSSHFGAAGIYSLMCAEEGLIGLVMSAGTPIMRAAGARGRALSNAPTSYAVPGDEFPVILDAAMSVVAGQKVLMAAQRGESIPEGWIVDAEGKPSTDPNDYLEAGGALVPIGDHKGSGLALFVEIMSSVLSGAAISNPTNFLQNPDEPSNTGHVFLAIDPSRFLKPEEFQSRLTRLTDSIRNAEPAVGVERVFAPGEMEFEKEALSTVNGLALPNTVWDGLVEAAKHYDKESALIATLRAQPD